MRDENYGDKERMDKMSEETEWKSNLALKGNKNEGRKLRRRLARIERRDREMKDVTQMI